MDRPWHLGVRSRENRFLEAYVVPALLVALWACSFAAAFEGNGPACEAPQQPHLMLETAEGSIEIEFVPAAAPAAIERLIRLARGPIFDSGAVGSDAPHRNVGYFDGLEFDRAHPHSSLSTSVRQPVESFLIRTLIDAEALGLDQRRIATTSEANQVWQFEIYPHYAHIAADVSPHVRLVEWREKWDQSYSADFLVGVSRKDIFEALGHVFARGLESLPVTRGSVALETYDATWSTPRLVIALEDARNLDGLRMVVGRVVDGLDLADRISARPLTPTKALKNTPLAPVRISSARIECRSVNEPDGGG